jgi:negative regulator of sigma E activity
MRKAFIAAVVLGALASPLAADRADDDLAAVKKAVGATVEAEAKPPAEETAPPRVEKAPAEERRVAKVRSRKGEPQWFRVRIAEKGEKRSRVSVNLPLDLVRALGEDWPIEACHHGHHTVGDVLRALDSGESLVDIEDGEATVRVWVE